MMLSRDIEKWVIEELMEIPDLDRAGLLARWERALGRPPPKGISRRLLEYCAAYQVQVKAFGGLKTTIQRRLRNRVMSKEKLAKSSQAPRQSKLLLPGTRLVREWHGVTHTVDVLEKGFLYNGDVYKSLSRVACVITGARWSGPRFFGL